MAASVLTDTPPSDSQLPAFNLNVAMSLKSALQLRRLSKFVLAVPLIACCSNWAVASSTVTSNVGSGSLDDWLALGLAMLAALYCVQKRE